MVYEIAVFDVQLFPIISEEGASAPWTDFSAACALPATLVRIVRLVRYKIHCARKGYKT